jgi:DNA-binding PadR family transcriptional regulator
MADRPLRSPLSPVILGLLAEQPLHPYGMQVLIRKRGHDRILGRGRASLYDTAGRLVDAGLIEVHATEKHGRRPERTVYRITAAGVDSLQAWIRQTLVDPEQAGQFTAALSFMYVLSQDEVLELLAARLAAVEVLTQAGRTDLEEALAAGVPAIFLSEGRYTLAIRDAERVWLETFITQLRDRQLSWPTPRPRTEGSA